MSKKANRPLSAKEQAFHKKHLNHGGDVTVHPLRKNTKNRSGAPRPGVLHKCNDCGKAHFEPDQK